jgi:hypothetical protein
MQQTRTESAIAAAIHRERMIAMLQSGRQRTASIRSGSFSDRGHGRSPRGSLAPRG